MSDIVLWGALALCAVVMLIYYTRTKTPLRAAFKGMLGGTAALLALYFFGGIIGAEVPITPFTALLCVVLGAPGIIAAAVFIWIFK